MTDEQFEQLKSLATTHSKGFQFLENREKIPVNRFQGDQSFLDAGSKNVWAAFRACHIVACTLLKVMTFVRDAKGKEVDPGMIKDLRGIMTHPNKYDTWEELIYQWVFHMKLTGKAYWFKDEVDGAGRPRAIYPLLPQCVFPVPSATEKIGGYVYRVNGRDRHFKPEDIIMFRRPHPSDPIGGLGDVAASEGLFNEFINRQTLNEKFIQNGATPSGVLIKDDESPDPTAWELLKQKFNSLYSGKANAGKVAFLNGKWTYQQLGLNSKDMEALAREQYTTENIFLAMGVPLSVAGLEKAANYATSKTDDIRFRRDECVPLWDLLVARLNSPMPLGLVRAFNEGYRLDYRIDGLIDVGQIAKDYAQAVQLGAITPNEMRVAMGLAKSDNPLMDQYFIGGVPIELAGFVKSPDMAISKIIGRVAPESVAA